MAKPASIPRWSSASPGTTTVEPTEGKKDVGFVAGEQPTAEQLNWLLYWNGQWADWLDTEVAEYTINIPASEGVPGASGWVFTRDIVTLSGPARWESPGTANRELVFPVTLPTGVRVLAVRAYVKGGSTTNLSMKVIKSNGTVSAPTQLGSTQTTSGSGDQTLTVSGLTDTVAAGEYFEVGFISGATDTNQRVYAIAVDVDRP